MEEFPESDKEPVDIADSFKREISTSAQEENSTENFTNHTS